ncbi:MAG TPA: LacI family DNA-binding transcriptional regulator [Devosia sp.]|jgi:LacI family transcriptional regulator|nr:LacI family DNA-binding transcriptional regulator [Devosia sp.]
MGRSTARLKDIATRTGFSVNTVSLALRGSPRIAEGTRLTIVQAAEALNYLPNHIAKSLVSRETRTIGLVLTSITNPILTRVAQAIELRLAELGYSTLFATSNGRPDEEIKAVEMFRSRQVDGMLIYPCSHRELNHIRKVRAAGYPIVLLAGDADAGVDVVGMDTRQGGYAAVRHLLDCGHRRIGLIDGGKQRGNLEKYDGYRRALDEAGLTDDPALHVVPVAHSVAGGFDAMSELMARGNGMTAVLAATDSLALGALRWTQQHELRVPQDMAIVGFDNIEFAQFAATPITSVDYAVDLVTERAVDRLIGLIRAEDSLPEAEVMLIEAELIVRESSAEPR